MRDRRATTAPARHHPRPDPPGPRGDRLADRPHDPRHGRAQHWSPSMTCARSRATSAASRAPERWPRRSTSRTPAASGSATSCAGSKRSRTSRSRSSTTRSARLTVDCHWPDHDLVIELDTDQTHGTAWKQRDDAERDAWLQTGGQGRASGYSARLGPGAARARQLRRDVLTLSAAASRRSNSSARELHRAEAHRVVGRRLDVARARSPAAASALERADEQDVARVRHARGTSTRGTRRGRCVTPIIPAASSAASGPYLERVRQAGAAQQRVLLGDPRRPARRRRRAAARPRAAPRRRRRTRESTRNVERIAVPQ